MLIFFHYNSFLKLKTPFLDEAPDTGDDSDEDLVTNYLNNGPAGSGTNGGTDNLVPSIHITPQSPSGNHVLGMNF